MLADEIKQTIKNRYAKFAESGSNPDLPPASDKKRADLLSTTHLYTEKELAMVPPRARHLFQGCGNPTGALTLRPGDSVVDLGCGGGLDVILAANKVGCQGRVFGADIAGQMVKQARGAVAESGLPSENITFRETDIEGRHLPKSFADVLIANSVIRLCPEKDLVFRNIFRILRPGGQLVVSDIVLIADIDPELRERLQGAWCGWAGGIMAEDYYTQMLAGLSFIDIHTVSCRPLTAEELEAAACWPDEGYGSRPGQDDLAQLAGKLAAVTMSATRPPLNC